MEYELIDFTIETGDEKSLSVNRVVHDNSEVDYNTTIEYDEQGIPKGFSKAEIKQREKIIKDFYAKWIQCNPSKKIWNDSLSDYIHVKFASINETFAKASRTYESTCAIFRLDEILKTAIVIEEHTVKHNKNQKVYEKMLEMKALEKVKLTVGLQRTSQEFVQYCISVPTNEKSSSKKR